MTGLKNLQNLQILYVNDNYLSSVGNRTFFGLSHLKTLNLIPSLSWSKFDILPGTSPFQDLPSLQTLLIEYVTITPVTFVGIEKLQFLDISVRNMTTSTPFDKLSTLQYLRVYFWRMNCSCFTKNLFTGLDRLKYLYIDSLIDECYVNITFCPLVSLKLLHLEQLLINLSNACLQTIPLKIYESVFVQWKFHFPSKLQAPFKSYLRLRRRL